MGCEREKLLAVMRGLYSEILARCQSEIDSQTCERVLSPLALLVSKLEYETAEQALAELL